ncbi:hypothetical protein G9C98_005065 [Cotesia typhae]|uniref:Uncharacterized protein n=1 Tax=Cotesia typhae TaxID=2053667 RepID=A0A8J5R097_9HYME|nr:hypothetical protein G9C98_005065 [Cotesia typhae]
MGRIEIYQEFCSGALATADIHQLNLIMEVLGTPRDEFMLKISSESAKNYIQSLPPLKKKSFKEVFRGANPLAHLVSLLIFPMVALKRSTSAASSFNTFDILYVGVRVELFDLTDGTSNTLLVRRLLLALAHPYLAQYADPTDEPLSLPYDQSFEDMELPVEKWKELIYHEAVNFVPQQLPSTSAAADPSAI